MSKLQGKAQVVKLKIPLVGTSVPKQHNGNVGRFVESKLEQVGHNVNKGKGIDLPEEELEVKSRKKKSKSAHSIGSITIDEIKSTAWDNTNLKQKCQRQFRISYDDVKSVISEAKIYDLTDNYIQEKLKEGYESGRKMIIEGNRNDYIRSSKWTCFQRQTDNSYQFRIPDSAMKSILEISNNNFRNLFQ